MLFCVGQAIEWPVVWRGGIVWYAVLGAITVMSMTSCCGLELCGVVWHNDVECCNTILYCEVISLPALL